MAARAILVRLNDPKRTLALACLGLALIVFAQMAGWDPRNIRCLFSLSPGCAAYCLNRSPNLTSAQLKVQAIGNIKYVGSDEALVEYLVEAQNASAADEASPNSSQIKLAAFHESFYRWRLENQ